MRFPPPPEVPAEQIGEGRLPLRYEDVAQDGRLKLETMTHALAAACWRGLLSRHPITVATRRDGVVPIMSRMWIEEGDAPIGITEPLAATGRFELAHALDATGDVDRLLLVLHADVRGRRGRTYGPPPEGAGAPIEVGRIQIEHVFTRPFAPPAERRVRRLDVPGLAPVPATRRAWDPPSRSGALPHGATAVEAAERPDAATTVLGMVHSDSNQHVNSLVYLRMFEEAALRRLAALGTATQSLLARRTEIAYRKPLFVGQRARVHLRAFELDGAVGAAGCFRLDGEDGGAAHAYARMIFA